MVSTITKVLPRHSSLAFLFAALALRVKGNVVVGVWTGITSVALACLLPLKARLSWDVAGWRWGAEAWLPDDGTVTSG